MNIAIILSGGVGTRMHTGGVPKQYIEVAGKPILCYTLEVFERCPDVDGIVIVAASNWQEQIVQWVNTYSIRKFSQFALPGDTRQESILNGLNSCSQLSESDRDNVIIHDAVRPCVTGKLLSACFQALEGHDGCMPVVPVKDTIYLSRDGVSISQLLARDSLYAGQAPEAFRLKKYLDINRRASKEELAQTRGTSEIAFRNGMDVCLIPGEDDNFKITNRMDLDRFQALVEREI